jgi:tRNA-splicing ligase RtcB
MKLEPLQAMNSMVFEARASERVKMRVPVRVVADAWLLAQIQRDKSLDQLANVTTLPGIYGFAVGMPDMHEGYGFPVGGVAATMAPDGVVSPGGIGFDINCGVRLLASDLSYGEARVHIEALVHELSRSVPTGYGRGGRLSLDANELSLVRERGAECVIREHGLGEEADLDMIESRGRLSDARPDAVSDRAKQRGADQLGTLGGGNHFLEVQRVSDLIDAAAAEALGLFEGQICVLIHTGSRGLGHQVCTDYVKRMGDATRRYGIELVDRQLACAPLSSPEGRDYWAAMCAAANFAWGNRQALTQRVRDVFARVLTGSKLRVVYDVAHNIAKMERFGDRTLCVHRKGATRAFGPKNPELPPRYRGVGQPVLVPGSMGTSSFVLVGTDASETISWNSACHGAGRAMSRSAAKRKVTGAELRKELERQGILVRCASNQELAEEAPVAYKDVDRVVDVLVGAGVARKVARLRPLGVLKG